MEIRLILGSYAWSTQTNSYRPAHTAEFRLAFSMSMSGTASFVRFSPADEFTACDDDGTIELHPVILDGGVI